MPGRSDAGERSCSCRGVKLQLAVPRFPMTERPMQAAHLTCIALIRGPEVVIWNSGLLRAVALLVVIQRGLPPEELRSLACCRVFVKFPQKSQVLRY